MSASRLTADQVIFDMRAATSPVISPDGLTIVYVLGTTDRESASPVSHLWLIDRDGDHNRQLTTYGVTNSGPAWSPDGASIAFVAVDKDEKPFSIRVIAMGGGESREVARHGKSPSGLAWSPDGSQIAYSLGVDPDEPEAGDQTPKSPPPPRVVRSLQYKEDIRGIQNTTHLQVFLVSVEGGEPRQLTTIRRDHAAPDWSPDGSRLAVKIVEEIILFQRLGIVDVETGETTLIGEPTWSLGTFGWTPDGNSLFFDGGPGKLAQTDFYRFDVANGHLESLTDDLQFVPAGGFAGFSPPDRPVWLPSGLALVHGTQSSRSGLWTVNPNDGDVTEICRFEAGHSGLSIDASLRFAVQTISTPTHPGEVVVVDLEDLTQSVVTHLNDDLLADSPVGNVVSITTMSGGETIEAWITYPPDFDEQESYPVVLEVHGGPYGYFGASFNPAAHLLAAEGNIVVSSNPRGSTSYGRRFAEMVIGDWGGGDWEDVQAALDAVLAQPYADDQRTGIFGYSYGGFMTSWAIGQTNRFKAAVCGAPVFDFESFYGTSDIAHSLGVELWGGTPPAHREWMTAHSPSTYIANAVTPTLILHGESDVRCPTGQGEELFAALMTQGVDTEFVRYPNSNHLFPWIGPPSYQIDYHTRVGEWFRKYLGA